MSPVAFGSVKEGIRSEKCEVLPGPGLLRNTGLLFAAASGEKHSAMHIRSLVLYTAVPGQLLRFYEDVLGCKVTTQDDGFTVLCDETELSFRQAVSGAPTYHFAFNIPYHQVAEAHSWSAARVPLLQLVDGGTLARFINWDAAAFYFFDPAGNIVEFIGRASINPHSNKPFGGVSLISVSEIGIVTDDVPLTCRQLDTIWQVPLFSRQPPSANFAAAGDDSGLFIVVPEGRHWYPTQVAAAKAPLEVTFETDDGYLRRLELSGVGRQ